MKLTELEAEYLSGFNVRDFYVSPLGRAQVTAEYTLKKINRLQLDECCFIKYLLTGKIMCRNLKGEWML